VLAFWCSIDTKGFGMSKLKLVSNTEPRTSVWNIIAPWSMVILGSIAIFAACMSANEVEKREIAAKCEVYHENPTWLSTTDLKVWYKLNCYDGSIKNLKVTNETRQGGCTNPEH
jgi:hypothetical protein